MKKLKFQTIEAVPQALLSSALVTLQKWLEPYSLPADYADFLLQFNGGQLAQENKYWAIPHNFKDNFIEEVNGISIQLLYWLSSEVYPSLTLRVVNGELQTRIPSASFIIASDDFGNKILLSLDNKSHGGVFFWDHEAEGFAPPNNEWHNVAQIATSFNEFVDGLCAEP